MGRSYTKAAGNAYDKMIDLLRNEYGVCDASNTWGGFPVEHFAEMGDEQPDGAITGAIYRTSTLSNKCRKVGSFRIEPDGTVTRWATSKAHHRRIITRYGNAVSELNKTMSVLLA